MNDKQSGDGLGAGPEVLPFCADSAGKFRAEALHKRVAERGLGAQARRIAFELLVHDAIHKVWSESNNHRPLFSLPCHFHRRMCGQEMKLACLDAMTGRLQFIRPAPIDLEGGVLMHNQGDLRRDQPRALRIGMEQVAVDHCGRIDKPPEKLRERQWRVRGKIDHKNIWHNTPMNDQSVWGRPPVI